MKLTKEQLAMKEICLEQTKAYEQHMNELPESIRNVWYEMVAHMREEYYMDELWDGKELIFCSENEQIIKMTLAHDKIDIAQMSSKQPPKRVMPEVTRLSAIGTRCDMCIMNSENIEKQDRRAEFEVWNAKVFGYDHDYTDDGCFGKYCGSINDIGRGTPGLTAEEITYTIYPYWWPKSRLNHSRNS